MKKYLPPYSALVICLLFFASSCQAPKDLIYKDFKNLKLDEVGFGATTLKVDLIYYNPNNFGLQLKYTDLDIYIDNNYLGHSSQDYQITIPKRADFTLPLEVKVDMKNLVKNTFLTLLQKQVTVKITGTVKLGKANVYKSFPVNYEGVQQFSLFK